MTDQDLRRMVQESAQDVEVPERLWPEEVRKRMEQKNKPGKWQRLGSFRRQLGAAAAILVLAVCLTAIAALGDWGTDSSGPLAGQSAEGRNQQSGQAGDPEEAAATGLTKGLEDGMAAGLADVPAGSADASMAKREPKADAGDMFAVARDYDQVYALLEESQEFYYNTYGATEDSVKMEPAAAPDASASAGTGTMREDFQQDSAAEGSQQGYSGTNVQTEGVDESDIIKTDGSYIYTVCQDGVVITDISGEAMAQAGRIRLEDAGARVMEMYVQGDCLNLIVQQAESGLERQEEEKGRIAEDVFYMDTASVTHLLTYDIKNRKKPVLAGDVSQDGSYYTSRKIGDILYLFTTEYDMSEIPRIGGCQVAYDCIYLPERGRQGLLVSSVDVRKPAAVQDQIMVVNDYVDIYVSAGAMYLYQYSWQDQNPVTQIAKFSLDKGSIQAVGSTSVKGEILDTFAINEGSGQLRVLTTDWGSDVESNNLYVLDQRLKPVGSLQGLAAGEQIYAARFLGNIAYFVTYRNTDPLFAVDLTDPANPQVLAELKITGFSEYLHFWGEDKLLGIGYETDPDTGRREGIKLTMFDISNPAELGVRDSVVLKGMDYSPAMDDYKSVLADSGANLFGFAAVDYFESGEENSYYLYQWGQEGFERLLEAELDSEASMQTVLHLYRGLYSGARFYLADPDGVTSYDREKNYERIESLKY